MPFQKEEPVRRFTITFAFLLLAVIVACAEITPVFVQLENQKYTTNTTYTVPADKVLVIEHVHVIGSTNLSAELPFITASCAVNSHYYESGFMPVLWSEANRWKDNDGSYHAFVTLSPSIKVPSGCTLGITRNSESAPGDIKANIAMLMGMLVATSDLYASIESEVEEIAAAGPDVDMLLRLGSPRPAIVRMDKADDLLSTWEHTRDVTISVTTNPLLRDVTYTPTGNDKEFFQFRARPR